MSCEHRPSIKYMGPSFQELSQKPHPDTSVDISLVRTVTWFPCISQESGNTSSNKMGIS